MCAQDTFLSTLAEKSDHVATKGLRGAWVSRGKLLSGMPVVSGVRSQMLRSE